MLLTTYSRGSLVIVTPKYLIVATLCNGREAALKEGGERSRGRICDLDQFMLNPECFHTP